MKTIKDKKYSFNHTKERLRERFDLLLTEKEYESLCKLCESNVNYADTLVVKESEDQEIYQLFFKGYMIKFVFNNKKGYITTALPKRKE